jgi:predicted AAA+ superfamily ATPase
MLLYWFGAMVVMDKSILRAVVTDQRAFIRTEKKEVPREIVQRLSLVSPSIAHLIKGVRRCGKSTACRQFVEKEFGDDFWFVNFDDERLARFEIDDFQKLVEVLNEEFGPKKAFFLDEIQNVPKWELFINRILREGFFVLITGSNADLLSREMGTHLTGRHIDFELYPFSFREYLLAKGKTIEAPPWNTEKQSQLRKEFAHYLYEGGMPERVMTQNPQSILDIPSDVIQKDIVKRYSIRKPGELKNVVQFLIANAGNEITYPQLAVGANLKSPLTAQKFTQYAEETYLIFLVNRFEPKLKMREKNPKKVYCIDNGLAYLMNPSLSENKGRLLENLVAVELKRKQKKIFYYVNKNRTKTDFVVQEDQKIRQAIQVCYDPSNPKTTEREEKALLQTLQELKLKKGIILTNDVENEKTIQGKTIAYVPVWKWLLSNNKGE